MKTIQRSFSVLLICALLLGNMAFGILPDLLTLDVKGLQYDVLTYSTYGSEITITRCDDSVSGFYAIPSEINGFPVTTIDWSAFQGCKKLTGIIIPDTVHCIEAQAFYNCSALRSITIPDSVEKIGFDAFFGTAYYNSSYNWYAGFLYIGNCLIRASQNGLLGIPNLDTHLIADSAFTGCKNITSFSIPDSVEYIGAHAFQGCSSLTSIFVSDHITDIGMYAFHETGFYNNAKNWENGILYLNDYLLQANTQVKNGCQIRPGTKLICEYAFGECDGLTEIDLPDSIVRIGDHAFSRGVNVLHFPDHLKWIGNAAFSYIKNREIVLPEGISHIGDIAFSDSDTLQTVYVPSSVNHIGIAPFFSTALLQIEVDPSNPCYCDEDGVLFTKDRSALIEYPHGRSDTQYSVPPDVQYVSSYAFFSCTNLQYVDLSLGILQIGAEAFAYSGLTSVAIPDSVLQICLGAFSYCPLDSLFIPQSVIVIEDPSSTSGGIDYRFIVDDRNTVYSSDVYGALFNKKKTILYYFPKSSETYGYIVPDGVQEIWDFAFSDSKIKGIVLPNSLKRIGVYAFEHCLELESIYIPDSVQDIEYGAFYSCVCLKQVVLPSGVKNINDSVFGNCLNLQFVHIPSTVKNIDEYAFQGSSPVLCSDADSAVIRAFAEKNSLEFHVCDGSNHKGISVSLMNKSLTVAYKSQTKLDVELKKAESCTVTWTTSDPQIATVDESGNVTARRTGSVKIICTITDKDGESFSDTCDVHVQFTFWQWLIRIFLFGFLWY